MVDLNELAAMARHDEQAAHDLLAAIRPMVTRICRARLSDPAWAEDATQEALAAIWTGLPRWKNDKPFAHWAARVAVNQAVNVHRTLGRAVPCDPEVLASLNCDHAPDVADRAVRGDDWARLRVLMDRLPVNYQHVLMLRIGYDIPVADVARILGPMGQPAVRLLQHRATARLRVLAGRVAA